MTAALELHDLAVGYRQGRRVTTVLRDVDAHADAGSVVALVGPNGAGKSTLLRSVAGLQPLLAGQVLIDGDAASRVGRRELARRLAVVLTDRVEVPHLRVQQLVELGRHPRLTPGARLSKHDRSVCAEALDLVGVTALADRPVESLSDGQRQRVMIARALAQEPAVLLLDEPTSFLDPPARIAVMRVLRTIARDRGTAVVVCTHELELALRYSDGLWVATPGGTLVTGAPLELARRGVIGQAFATPGVRFDPHALAFVEAADRPRGEPTGLAGP